jgi:NAD+ synthase
MPSPYSSSGTQDDARILARNLGIELLEFSIKEAMELYDRMLKPVFGDRPADITEENLQARIRGVLLMGLSNKFGDLLVTTGNKSEMSVGYATLYGDMCGGFAPIKDVYKTLVYRLSHWRNKNHPKGLLGPASAVMPENILTRAPTAELKANQTDQDTLPPYDKLDDILECLVEKEMSVDAIVARGHTLATVQKVLKMLRNSEYKRQQAAPGTKVTSRAFGRDRRYPKTNKFLK